MKTILFLMGLYFISSPNLIVKLGSKTTMLIDYPLRSLSHPNLIVKLGGKTTGFMTVPEMNLQRGLAATANPAGKYKYRVTSFTLRHVSQKGETNEYQEATVPFQSNVLDAIQSAQIGDSYYFSNIRIERQAWFNCYIYSDSISITIR